MFDTTEELLAQVRVGEESVLETKGLRVFQAQDGSARREHLLC